MVHLRHSARVNSTHKIIMRAVSKNCFARYWACRDNYPVPGKDASQRTSYRPLIKLTVVCIQTDGKTSTRKTPRLPGEKQEATTCSGRVQKGTINKWANHPAHTNACCIVDGIQNKQRSLTTYVDFIKAYDKVWRANLWAGGIGELGIPSCTTHIHSGSNHFYLTTMPTIPADRRVARTVA